MTRSEITNKINRAVDLWLARKPHTVHFQQVGLVTAVPMDSRRKMHTDCFRGPFDRIADFLAWECKPGERDKFTIIEVKSCLADFTSDGKWEHYLNFCNQFYFAVPHDFPIERIGDDPRVGIITMNKGAEPFREWNYLHVVRRSRRFDLSSSVDTNRLKFLLARKAYYRERNDKLELPTAGGEE